MLHIARVEPSHPELAALIAAADALSMELYPPQSRHPLGVADLARANATVLLARLDGRAIACAALVPQAPEYGEVKRMFVHEGARGRGLGRALLRRLETEARRLRLSLLRLETGRHSPAALNLYRRAGFKECAPFAAYDDDPLSVFLERAVAAGPVADFRPVGPGDVDTLLSLVRAFHDADGRALDAQGEAAVAAIGAGHALAAAWLIDVDDAVAGYLVLTHGYGIEYGGPDLFLDELYLIPEAQGRGFGREAMAFVEEQARATGATAVHLVVAPDNARARALYGRSGYEDGGWRVMSRRL